jgi:hypothetical protein
LPKNNKKAPLLNVQADDIQVISAVVMSRSLPTKELMTVTTPVKKAPIAIAIVAVKTNNTSCNVERKHAGLALLVWTGSMGCKSFDNVEPLSVGLIGLASSPACFSTSISMDPIIASATLPLFDRQILSQ